MTLARYKLLKPVPTQANGQCDRERKRLMGDYQNFEELPAWQEAKRLYNAVLDLLEQPKVPLTAGFRDQLDRAALAVPNSVAESSEHSMTGEAQTFLSMARESCEEVIWMVALVQGRPKLKRLARQLKAIRQLAATCAQRLEGLPASADAEPEEARPELLNKEKQALQFVQKAKDLRLSFLRGLKPDHPLYNTAEAQAAREQVEA